MTGQFKMTCHRSLRLADAAPMSIHSLAELVAGFANILHRTMSTLDNVNQIRVSTRNLLGDIKYLTGSRTFKFCHVARVLTRRTVFKASLPTTFNAGRPYTVTVHNRVKLRSAE